MRSIYFTEKKRERLKGRTDEAERLLTGPCRTKNDGGIAQLARAPALQAGGQGFESPHLHSIERSIARKGKQQVAYRPKIHFVNFGKLYLENFIQRDNYK